MLLCFAANTAPILQQLKIAPIDKHEPMEKIESTEPIDAMDKHDPVLPMLNTELVDHRLSMEFLDL